MLVAMGVLVVGVAVLLAVMSVGMRRWSVAEARKDAELHAPGAHTVTYVVPDGEDPVGVIAALTHAGFLAVEDHSGVHDRVLVQCEAEDREKVRDVIAHVQRPGYDGPAVVNRVVFEDER
jgi:hypothetical protein